MPASVKVSNSWKTATGLSVKVAGTWRTATSAFINVGGVWKQWFASRIQDTFTRASTASGLGTSTTGQVWTALRGNWRVGGSNNALSDDAASTYPIASINFGNSDVKTQTDTSGGVGVAFWITDSGSWWASYPRYTSVTNTFCDQSQVTNFSNPPSGSCCSGVTTGSTSVCDQTQVTNTNNPPSGSCCSGVTTSGGGSTCTGTQVTNTSNPPSGSCCSGVTTGGGGTSNVCDQSQVTNQSNPPSASCCSGVTTGGGGTSNVCDQSSVSCSNSSSSSCGGTCCSGVSTGGGGQTTVCDQGRVDTYGFGCPAGYCAGEFSETVNSSYCGGATCCRSTNYDALVNCGGCNLPQDSGSYQCGSGQTYGSFNGQPYGCYTYSDGTTEYQVNDGGSCSSMGSGWQQVGCSNCTGGGPCGQAGFVCCRRSSGAAGYTYVGAATYVASWCVNTVTTAFSYTQYFCYTSTRNVTAPTTYSCYTSTRPVTNPTTYSCYTSTRPVTNPTTYSCYTSQVTQPTYYSCYTATRSVATYSCYTGTRSVTTYTSDLVLVSSVSGTVAVASALNLATNTSGFATVGSVYVTTAGSTVTSSAYSGSNLTGSQVGSTLSLTPSSPVRGTSVGIIKAPSTGSQGSTTDNFLTTI